MRVLEVGPGTNRSYTFKPRAPVGSTPVFLDAEPPSPELREWDWVRGSADLLPFRDSAFDLVIANHVAEHLADWRRFIGESYRVLRRGGALEIAVPNFLSRNALADPSHRHVFNVITLALALKRRGFTTVFVNSAGSLFPPPLRKILCVVLNLMLDEIRLRGVKP